jgi:hypothetical protein
MLIVGLVVCEQRVDREASWGFVPEKDVLLIYPSLLPCTVALEYDPDIPEGILLRSRHCYEEQAAKIEDYTGVTPPNLQCR